MSETPGERFLLEEYRAVQEAFLRNEEMGERRVNLLLTFVGAVLAALTAGFIRDDRKAAAGAAIVGLTALLLFGLSTLARIIRRNLESSRYLRAAAKIRAHFVAMSPEIESRLSFGIDGEKPRRSREWRQLYSPRTGGAAENVELLNGMVFAGLGGSAVAYVTENAGVIAAATIGAFAAGMVLQFAWVKYRYEHPRD